MIALPEEFKKNALAALLEARKNFDGTDGVFARQYRINPSIFSRLKNGEDAGNLIKDDRWMYIGEKLNVTAGKKKWNTVDTEVLKNMREQALFCKSFSKSIMLVDDTGIGKSFNGRHLARTMKNTFFIDLSQAKQKADFIRLFARTVGVDDKGGLTDMKKRIKYVLKILPQPLVILDEAGDVADSTFLEIKEIWNDTEGSVGWYMMGAEGLQNKVERNMNNKKPGFAEIFSRFGERYNHIAPEERGERITFYRRLITDVLQANMDDKKRLPEIVNRCLKNDSGRISGLRRAEALLMMN